MKRIWSLFTANIGSIFRDPYLLFFDLLFPLVLFFFFVSIFAPSPQEVIFEFYVYAPTGQPVIAAAAQTFGDSLRLTFVDAAVQDPVAFVIRESLRQRKTSGLLVFPSNWEQYLHQGKSITLALHAPQDNPTLFPMISALTQELLLQLDLSPPMPPIQIQPYPLEPKAQSNVAQVVLTTLLTVWLIVGGMHAVSQYAYLQTSGMYKRLLITPLHKHELVAEIVLEALVVTSGVSLSLLSLAAVRHQVVFFQSVAQGVILGLTMVIMVVLSASLGLFIALLAKEPTRAIWGPLTVYLGLMFFSGLAIPVTFFPQHLRLLAEALPVRRLAVTLQAALIYEQTPSWTLFVYPSGVAVLLFLGILALMSWRQDR